MMPRTQYAPIGDGYVAYQVLGDGPVDLVYVFGFEGHVEAQWDYPQLARFLERLSSFSRLIVFNRRGSGMSDPIDPENITLEQWMEDVRVVMDAASSERAVVFGGTEGGPMAMMFAASFPERTSGLILGNSWANFSSSDDTFGLPEPAAEAFWGEVIRAMYMEALALNEDARRGLERFFAADAAEIEHILRLFRYATPPGLTR